MYKEQEVGFTIVLEKILFHEGGKIFNETYVFGDKKTLNQLSVQTGTHKNIKYTNIVDYDVFENLINDAAEIDLSNNIKIQNS